MRHLQPRPLKPTLDIKPFVRLATIQNCLIAPSLLRHKIQRLNNAQSQFLALLIHRNSDVFNVSDKPELVDEFALDDQRAGADDVGGGVGDAEEEVGVGARGHPGVAFVPLLGKGLVVVRDPGNGIEDWEIRVNHLLSYIAYCRQHSQYI
jgi:hypothetical protein